MDYQGPQAADFIDITALNRRYLEAARRGALSAGLLPGARLDALRELPARHIERLATVPFLLLSVRENDAAFWGAVLDNSNVADLFAADRHADPALRQLGTATLTLVWQLARSNRYAARLVAGATAGWCEHIGGHSLISLLDRCSGHPELPVARMADNSAFWQRLLGPGTSRQPEVRRAAHLCALQTMLTSINDRAYRMLDSAACRTPTPPTLAGGRSKRRKGGK